MYYSEKITPEILEKIVSGEDTRVYKTNGSRIVFSRKCHYCDGEYWPSRRNQKYCSNSCRVLTCQKKSKHKSRSPQNGLTRITKKETLSERKSSGQVDWKQVGESALGSAAIEGIKYLAHDLPNAQKIDRILQILEAKAIAHTPIRKYPLSFIGMEQFQNIFIAVFKDPGNGQIFGYDSLGNWLVKRDGKWYRVNG